MHEESNRFLMYWEIRDRRCNMAPACATSRLLTLSNLMLITVLFCFLYIVPRYFCLVSWDDLENSLVQLFDLAMNVMVECCCVIQIVPFWLYVGVQGCQALNVTWYVFVFILHSLLSNKIILISVKGDLIC